MIHAALWLISLCIVLFIGGIVLLLVFGTLASIPKDAWGVIIFAAIGLGILANSHFQHEVQLRNSCEEQVFQVYPVGSVRLDDGSFDGYSNALYACESKYTFWNFTD